MGELEFWKALTCFGEEPVKTVIQDPQWHEMFSDVFESLDSKDDRVRYNTIIPLAMLKAMASFEPHQYAFGYRNNVLKCRPRSEEIPAGFIILSPLEALERFGSELLLEAVDYGTAIANENELS